MSLFPYPFVSKFGCAIALVVAAGLGSISLAEPLQKRDQRLFVDLSAKPDPRALLAFNHCIIDPSSGAELGPGRELGHVYYARLSGIALPVGSNLAAEAAMSGLTLKIEGPSDSSFLLDILHPDWADWMIEHHAKTAAQQGFGGFLVQGATDLPQLDALRPAKAAEHRRAFVAMIQRLHQRFPDMPILLHRGFDLVPELQPYLHGVLIDGVFQAKKGEFPVTVSEVTAQAVEKIIRQIQSCGLKVMAVEFGHPDQPKSNRAAAARLEALGCLPFVTTPALAGTVLGPDLPAAEHVLVLHGWDPEQTQVSQRAAAQTWSAHTLAPALHWLGLEPQYVSVPEWTLAQNTVAQLMQPPPAAIVLDPETELSPASQQALAAWLVAAAANDIPILLAGQPFTDPLGWKELANGLRLQGSGTVSEGPERARLARFDAAWLQPRELPEQHTLRTLDLQAPTGISAILSYRPSAAESKPFDACFLAPWGGVWMARTAHAPLDTYRFLEAALQRQNSAPTVDTSTLAGHQIYLSTVQGKGFCEKSWLPGSPLCSQVLAEELVNFPGLPVTIALAEADIRGWSEGSHPSEAMRYEAIARALYALPQVEPATNSYSRPLDWNPERFQSGALRPVLPDSRSGLEREIAGSMAYLHRRLIPPGKNPLFLLWPEGAPPSAAAIEQLHAVGGLHLPGSWKSGWNMRPAELPGSTSSSAELPSPSNAAAIAQAWFDLHQPTSKARRLGPIHLAYSFADLKQPATLDALRQIWSWCADQPLHPMTASTYARFAQASAEIQIYPVSDHHWRVITQGGSTTLRLPAHRGLPDLARSTGLIGYRQVGDQLYLQLNGQSLSDIHLRPAAELPPHLHLVAADRLVDFHQLTADSARFRLQGRDPAIVTLGGLIPGGLYFITASAQQTTQHADAEGQLTFRAPALATISIQPHSGKPYAAR